jgi:serine/threonine protein kinase
MNQAGMEDASFEERKSSIDAYKRRPIEFKPSRIEADIDEIHVPVHIDAQLDTTQSPDPAISFLSSLSPYGHCPNVSARYNKKSRIGEGTYGIVYKALDTLTSDYVALKRCLPHHQSTDGFPITTLREIQILRELSEYNHPNIVKLLQVAVSSKESGVFLVFEYAHYDLAALIDKEYGKLKRSPFTVQNVKQLSKQLISAVQFLHERNIIHRDLKLSNLLYQQNLGLLKLADFGLARRLGGVARRIGAKLSQNIKQESFRRAGEHFSDSSDKRLTPKVVSLWYRPIELLLGSNDYDESVDLWGLGCIIAELLLGEPLLRGKNEMDQIQQIFTLLGPPNENSWPLLTTMPLISNRTVLIPTIQDWKRKVDVSKKGKGSLLDIFGDILSVHGIQLLSNLLRYDPSTRWRADMASESDWFIEAPLPTECKAMPVFPLDNDNR